MLQNDINYMPDISNINNRSEIYNVITQHVEKTCDFAENSADIIFKCQDGNVACGEQALLAIYSQLFRENVNFEEEIVVFALDYSMNVIKSLLKLLYSGKIEVSQCDLEPLNELCVMLGIPKNFEQSAKRNLIFKQEKNLSSRKAEVKINRKKRIFTANMDVSELTCDVCFKVFSKPYKLKNHQLIHLTSFPFICSNCGKGFKSKYKLNAHEKDHKKGLIQPKIVTGNTKEKVKVVKEYPCKDCGMIFSKAIERKKHIEANHKVIVNHSCVHCSSKFRTKKNLIAHLRVVHNDLERVLRHVCSICDKRFLRPSHLEEHMVRHNPVGQHPCMYCPKRCATKQDLDRHLASHKGENKHTCELCFKSFVHRSTYTVHVRRHLGQKPYYCKPCNKNFLQFKSLRAHLKVHEKKNDRTVLVTPSKSSRGGFHSYSYIDVVPEQPELEDMSNLVVANKPKELLPSSTQPPVYLPGPQYNKSTGFKLNQPTSQQQSNIVGTPAALKQQFITDYAEISRIGFQFPGGEADDGFAAIVEMESLFEPGPMDTPSQNILDEHNIS
eukprot:TRINITY_DN19640_c0_g1_i6.p1 TRINITY_DN19640_c0_g1~~TRINITY_DN19640_c0_g1_i6.p1  ORF type:complete len:554 (-),score=43.65 TRINITY_DN19640_c0_g1_i6:228-1889(-)